MTKEINDIIEYYLNSPEWLDIKNSNIINKLSCFHNEVKTGAPIDLKNQPEWSSHPLYIYNNEIVDVDALGNILYGVLGAYLNIDKTTLFIGASVAQTIDNWEFEIKLDDPRDVKWWKYGYNLYFNE